MLTVIGPDLFSLGVVSNSEAAYVQAQVMDNVRVAMVKYASFLGQSNVLKFTRSHNMIWKLPVFPYHTC